MIIRFFPAQPPGIGLRMSLRAEPGCHLSDLSLFLINPPRPICLHIWTRYYNCTLNNLKIQSEGFFVLNHVFCLARILIFAENLCFQSRTRKMSEHVKILKLDNRKTQRKHRFNKIFWAMWNFFLSQFQLQILLNWLSHTFLKSFLCSRFQQCGLGFVQILCILILRF